MFGLPLPAIEISWSWRKYSENLWIYQWYCHISVHSYCHGSL